MKTLPVLPLLAALAITSAASAATLHTPTVRAQFRAGRPGHVLFATVEPVTTLRVRAGADGTLTAFHVRPGERVSRGQRLGRLGGPTYAAAIASARAALRAAHKSDELAHDRLSATRARYPLLTNRGTLDLVRSRAARADAALAQARASLAALTANGVVDAPAAGTVASVLAADGERVGRGDALLRLQASGSLWLRGAVYGANALAAHAGATGVFTPADGGKPIAVRIANVIPAGAKDGVGIGLVPQHKHPRWFAGEGGLVTLSASGSREPAVPTRALVLHHGRWWVVEKVGGRFKPVRVKPDGAHRGWTWIASGIRAGDAVVARNAYLVFHRTFASAYANDD